MDDLTSGQFAPPPPPPQQAQPPGQPSQPGAPGRPPADGAKRAAHDEAYQRKRAFRELLPPEAREMRVAIFPARPGYEAKGSSRKILAILAPDWERLGLTDSQTLAAYLEERLGPGRYYCEPQDAQGLKDKDAPAWIVSTDDEEDTMDENFDEPRGSRRGFGLGFARGRRPGRLSTEDYDDEEPGRGAVLDDLTDEDPRTSRSNVADYLMMTAQSTSEEKREAMQQSQSLFQTMMVMQQQQREEDRRREEERRREENRIEEQRREERMREERNRQEEMARRDEERRERDRAAMEASNKRMELLVTTVSAALTAGAPILAKMLEKKEDPLMATLIAKATNSQQDPNSTLLLKHILDKSGNQDSMSSMFQGMAEMNRLSSQMMSEQMKTMLETTNDLNSRVLKKALDMAMSNPGADEDSKGTLSKIVEAVSAASSMVDSLGLKPQRPPQGMHPQQMQQQPGRPQQQQQHPGQPQQQQTQQQLTHQQMVDAIERHPQRDMILTIGALQAIQQGAYRGETNEQTDDQYASMINQLVSTMPQDLRQAILDDDEDKVMEICGPIIGETPEYLQWIQQDGVIQWLREFLPQLGPVIQQAQEMEQQAQQAPAQEDDTTVDQDADEGDGEEQEGDQDEGTTEEDDDDEAPL